MSRDGLKKVIASASCPIDEAIGFWESNGYGRDIADILVKRPDWNEVEISMAIELVRRSKYNPLVRSIIDRPDWKDAPIKKVIKLVDELIEHQALVASLISRPDYPIDKAISLTNRVGFHQAAVEALTSRKDWK